MSEAFNRNSKWNLYTGSLHFYPLQACLGALTVCEKAASASKHVYCILRRGQKKSTMITFVSKRFITLQVKDSVQNMAAWFYLLENDSPGCIELFSFPDQTIKYQNENTIKRRGRAPKPNGTSQSRC